LHHGRQPQKKLVGRFRERHKGALIGVYLAVFCPAAQGAIADFQLGTGFGPPRTSNDSLIDQSNGSLAMWGADHASSPSPQIAAAFFRRTRSAAVSANARSLRANSRSRSLTRFFSSFVARPRCALLARSQSFACSQAARHAAICAGKSPRLRQYSARSASLRAAVSNTAANLSREASPQSLHQRRAKAAPCRAPQPATCAVSPRKSPPPVTTAEWPRC
jgi:hypothetical protein